MLSCNKCKRPRPRSCAVVLSYSRSNFRLRWPFTVPFLSIAQFCAHGALNIAMLYTPPPCCGSYNFQYCVLLSTPDKQSRQCTLLSRSGTTVRQTPGRYLLIPRIVMNAPYALGSTPHMDCCCLVENARCRVLICPCRQIGKRQSTCRPPVQPRLRIYAIQ
jgi:hypothetical protein